MAPCSEPGDIDTSEFGIPGHAWLIASLSIALAGVVLLATPGPAVEGCFTAKGCMPIPHAPFGLALATLVAGSALSTWLGRVPRQWVVGWSAAIAAIAAQIGRAHV